MDGGVASDQEFGLTVQDSTISTIVRALQSAAAVIAAIFSVRWLGDGDAAKLAALPIAAVASVIIEYGLKKAPRRSAFLRRRLDARSAFEGTWIQDVKDVASDSDEQRPNSFAVFVVTYADGAYKVDGTAYDPAGKEHARWWSTEQTQFTEDGMSMTYLWGGTVMSRNSTRKDIARTGFARLTLDTSDSGTGKVDHVAERVSLVFNIQRVTPERIRRWKASAAPASLKDRQERDLFALYWAAQRPG